MNQNQRKSNQIQLPQNWFINRLLQICLLFIYIEYLCSEEYNRIKLRQRGGVELTRKDIKKEIFDYPPEETKYLHLSKPVGLVLFSEEELNELAIEFLVYSNLEQLQLYIDSALYFQPNFKTFLQNQKKLKILHFFVVFETFQCDQYIINDLISQAPWVKTVEIFYEPGDQCMQHLNLENHFLLEEIKFGGKTYQESFILADFITLPTENNSMKTLDISLEAFKEISLSEVFQNVNTALFQNIPNLETLKLNIDIHNSVLPPISFDGLIGAKDYLPNLKHLNITINQISGLNQQIFDGNFGTQLETLHITFSSSFNVLDISKITSMIEKNPNLTDLKFDVTKGVKLDFDPLEITSMINTINSIANLQHLYLDFGNEIDDTSLVEITNKENLQSYTLGFRYDAGEVVKQVEDYNRFFSGTLVNYMKFQYKIGTGPEQSVELSFPLASNPTEYTQLTEYPNPIVGSENSVASCIPGDHCIGCTQSISCLECLDRTHDKLVSGDSCTKLPVRCENDMFLFPACVECKKDVNLIPSTDCIECYPQYIQQTEAPYKCPVDACRNNFQIIGDKCLCPNPNLSQPDPYEYTYCNTCDTAFATYLPWSFDLLTIKIQFHEETPEIASDFPLLGQIHQYSKELCQYLFITEVNIDGVLVQNLLGLEPQCKYQRNLKLLEIILGEDNKFQRNTILRFNPDTFYFDNTDCTDSSPAVFITNLLTPDRVPLPDVYAQPQFTVSFPQDPIVQCQESVIQVKDFEGMGGKIPKISWGLVSTTSTEVQIDIISILDQATLDNVDTITFPADTFESEKEYVLEVIVESIQYVQTRQEFTIVVQKSEGIISQLKQFGGNTIMKKEKSSTLEAIHYNFRCQDGALVNIEPDNFQITIQDVTDPLSVQDLASYTANQIKQLYYIEPYSLEEGIYEYKLVVEYDGDTQESLFQFVMNSNPLSASIQNGDRTHCYLYELNLVGIVLNPSVPEENQKDGVTPTWSCKDLTNGTPSCIDYNDDPLVLAENSFSLSFGERVLKPYVNYQFSLTVEKDGDTSMAYALIFVAESTMPQLSVSLPDKFLINKVNIDEDIVATLNYDGDVESTRFSVLLQYNFDIVATKSFYYNEFSFQLQDLFNGYNLGNEQVVLKFSIFDPRFYLPTYVSVPLIINIGAQGGVITINQNTGISMDTQFTLSIDGIEANNPPLQYKLSYYQNINSYDEATSLGHFFVNQNQNVIYDYQSSPEFTTILPTCEVNKLNEKNECTLAISVMDRFGAVRNTTQTIEVSRESGREIMDLITEFEAKIDQTLPTPLEQITFWNLLALDLVQFDQKIEYCATGVCKNDGECLNNESDSTFSCKCKPDFFLNNCAVSGESNYQSYLQAKKKLYDKITAQLSDLSGIPITEAIKDQMRKSQNILNNNGDLIQLQDETELNELYTSIGSNVDSEILVIENGFLVDLQSRSNINLQRKVQKSVDSLNKFLISVDNCQQGLFKQDDMEKGKDFIGIIDKISQTFQKISHVNGDQKWYQGTSFSTQVGKSTRNIINQQFFGDKSSLQSLLTEENENNSVENPGIYLNEPTDIAVKIYNTQKRVFTTNPFQNDESFPFKNITNVVQDHQINLIVPETPTPPSTRFLQEEENGNTLRQPIKMHFVQEQLEERESKKIESVCTQKQGNSWDQTACRAEEEEQEDGTVKVVCVCDKLSPTSIGAVSIDVLSNVIIDSQIEEVFGQKGIEKLQQFEYHKSTVIYVYGAKLLVYIICMIEGRRLDKNNYEDFGKQEELEELKDENEDDIEKNVQKNSDSGGSDKDLEISKDNGQNEGKSKKAISLAKKLSVKDQTRISKHFVLDINSIASNSNQDEQQDSENLTSERTQTKISSRSRGSRFKKKGIQNNINDEQIGNINKKKKSRYLTKSGLMKKDKIIEEEQEGEEEERYGKQVQSISEFKNSNGNLHIDLNSQNSNRWGGGGLQIEDESTGRNMLSKRSNENEIEKEKEKKPKKDNFYPEISEQQQKKLEKKGIWEALFIPHVFFGIFLAYDRKLSRPKRLTVYYVNLLLLLALSSIFTQNAVDQFYSIVLSSFIAFLLNVPMAIINFLFKHKNKFLNLMGFVISILIKLVATYMIITAAAILGVEKSNVWCEQYFTVLLIDQLFTQTVKNSLMVYCIKKNMTLQKKNLFSKIFKNEYVAKYLSNI